MGQIANTKTTLFNEDELTPDGTGHVKSVHIAIECRRKVISRVIIDNGPALNVFPAMTLRKLALKIP